MALTDLGHGWSAVCGAELLGPFEDRHQVLVFFGDLEIIEASLVDALQPHTRAIHDLLLLTVNLISDLIPLFHVIFNRRVRDAMTHDAVAPVL